MMISPEMYVAEHEKDSFEELIVERKQLIERLDQLERMAYDDERKDEEWMSRPSPDVQYQMTLEYLAQLCIFTKEKYNKEVVWKEM